MITVDFQRLSIPLNHGLVNILDIGCGTGRHIGEAIRFPNVFAVGADVNHEDLKQARQKIHDLQAREQYRGQWAVIEASIYSLPFEDSSFEVVICAEVLEHIPDHRRAIQEIIRVLKTGGNLVVSVPRYGPERLCWALSQEYRTSPGGHIRIYRPQQLRRMLEEFGVQFQSSCFAHALHSPYWWLKCLAGIHQNNNPLVNLYHNLLVWDMMEKPKLTRCLENMLNPFIGKSVVLYYKK